MTTINPNNYPGTAATIVAYAAGEARFPAYDKEGTRGVLELSLPVDEGYTKDGEWVKTGTTWYTYSASGEYADALREVGKGDKVRIDGAKQEVREYEVNGEKRLGIGLRFGNFAILERKGSRQADAGFIPSGEEAGGF